MNNTDFTNYFILMSLINFSIGISNIEKNDSQEQRQIRIEEKIDKLLEIIDGKQ